MMQYKIITAFGVNRLETLVRRCLDKGWIPKGGPFVLGVEILPEAI